jgi:hypothetical protein
MRRVLGCWGEHVHDEAHPTATEAGGCDASCPPGGLDHFPIGNASRHFVSVMTNIRRKKDMSCRAMGLNPVNQGDQDGICVILFDNFIPLFTQILV